MSDCYLHSQKCNRMHFYSGLANVILCQKHSSFWIYFNSIQSTGMVKKMTQLACGIETISTGVNPGGMGMYPPPPPPPPLLGGGIACTNIPLTLFEDKITLNLTFIVKKLTFLTVKLLKTPKIARSLRSLAHKCILRLYLCGFASIFFMT